MNERDAVEILRQAMTRRGFLQAAGAAAVVGGLAACGTKGAAGGSPSASSTAAAQYPVDVSATDKSLTWANWTLYLDYDDTTKTYPSLVDFTKQTGIAASYREDIDDNTTFWGKVSGQLKAGQDIGYDIVTLTDWMAARWIRLGYTQPLDPTKIPNKGNILDTLANVPFDSGRTHSMTWQSGYGGLVWDKEKVPAGIKSVADLWKPEFAGKVTVLSEMRDTMGILMQAAGVDISGNFADSDFENALAVLDQQLTSGQVYKVQGNQYKEDLISGKAWVGIVWSGDIFQLNAENGDKWGFALPDSGGTLWSDNMMIPSTANHQSNAMELMNYYYDPAVAAKVAAYVNYICPVKGAQAEMEKIDPALAQSPLIFPTAEDLAKAKVFANLTADQEDKYNKLWLDTIGA